MSLFLSIMVSVVGSSHYYLWARLVRDTLVPQPLYGLLTGIFLTFGLGMPVGLATLSRMPGTLARVLLGILYAWMGWVFFTLWIRGGLDVASWLLNNWPGSTDALSDAQHLRLVRGLSMATVILGTLTCLWAFAVTRRGPVIERVNVTLARLPPGLDGFRMVQLSDLHVAPFLGARYVQTVVERTNALQPDVVVITGDLVDGSVAEMGATVALLAKVRAPQGVFFITGNHEYYSGVTSWLAYLNELGIRVLRNERVAIGHEGATLDLAGIDDWTAHHFGQGHGANLRQALAQRDPHRELILLAHQPRAIYEAAEQKVGLMLCGHTHGGQMWPFGWVVRLVQPYVRGLHRYKATQIYVNRGTGYWGPPLRLGATPEITLLTLHAPLA